MQSYIHSIGTPYCLNLKRVVLKSKVPITCIQSIIRGGHPAHKICSQINRFTLNNLLPGAR